MTEVVCPSGFTFDARKLSGRIFAQLAAGDAIGDLSGLIKACCVRVVDPGPYALGKDGEVNWKRVIAGDLALALVRLRAISIPPSHDGEVFKWKVTCPNESCVDESIASDGSEKRARHTLFWEVRLCDLPIIPLSDEARALVKAGNDSFPGKLLDGRRFTFKLPTDEDGAVIRKLLRDNGITAKANDAAQAREMLKPFITASVVTSIEGVPRDRVHQEVVDLDFWSIGDIQAQVGVADCGIDSFKGVCDACGTEFDIAVPLTPQLLLSLSSTVPKEEASPKRATPAELGSSSGSASPG